MSLYIQLYFVQRLWLDKCEYLQCATIWVILPWQKGTSKSGSSSGLCRQGFVDLLLSVSSWDSGCGKAPDLGPTSRPVGLSLGCPQDHSRAFGITNSWSQSPRLQFHWSVMQPGYWDFLLLKVGFIDKQYLHHPGACYKSESPALPQHYWLRACFPGVDRQVWEACFSASHPRLMGLNVTWKWKWFGSVAESWIDPEMLEPVGIVSRFYCFENRNITAADHHHKGRVQLESWGVTWLYWAWGLCPVKWRYAKMLPWGNHTPRSSPWSDLSTYLEEIHL